MKRILLSVAVLMASFANASEKELTFYKDLTHYKELKNIKLNERIYITLTDTAVLDTFNVSLEQDGKLITPKSIEIHPKSEENIFKLNKGSIVYVNGKESTLIENGKGFIKLRNKEGLITFVPKSKIEEISFTNDVDATSHIAQVIPNKALGETQMAYSYALGEMSWKPKYDLYLKDRKNIQLDYNIEIDNETLTSFEDVKVKFMLETISREYTNFTSDDNGGIFDYEQHFIMNGLNPRTYENESNMLMMAKSNMNMVSRSDSMSSYNKVSTSIENGKRAFSLSDAVSIPAKAKTSYPFKSALEMSYEKENNLFISPNLKKDEVLVPSSLLNVKNESGIALSSGIVRVFSGSKGFESTVIKEHYLDGSKGNEDMKIDIGENYGIKANILKNEDDLLLSIRVNEDQKKINRNFKLVLSKIDIRFDNDSNEETITIKNKNMISIDNYEKVVNIFKYQQNEISSSGYNFLKEEMEKLYEEELVIDLRKDLTKSIYILSER